MGVGGFGTWGMRTRMARPSPQAEAWSPTLARGVAKAGRVPAKLKRVRLRRTRGALRKRENDTWGLALLVLVVVTVVMVGIEVVPTILHRMP
ncbi:MAG: hypothetical protein P1V36_02925 [Planctomycetota bacterium]|nr:hypothetical protein [Planctomycetota bacterium]